MWQVRMDVCTRSNEDSKYCWDFLTDTGWHKDIFKAVIFHSKTNSCKTIKSTLMFKKNISNEKILFIRRIWSYTKPWHCWIICKCHWNGSSHPADFSNKDLFNIPCWNGGQKEDCDESIFFGSKPQRSSWGENQRLQLLLLLTCACQK